MNWSMAGSAAAQTCRMSHAPRQAAAARRSGCSPSSRLTLHAARDLNRRSSSSSTLQPPSHRGADRRHHERIRVEHEPVARIDLPSGFACRQLNGAGSCNVEVEAEQVDANAEPAAEDTLAARAKGSHMSY